MFIVFKKESSLYNFFWAKIIYNSCWIRICLDLEAAVGLQASAHLYLCRIFNESWDV